MKKITSIVLTTALLSIGLVSTGCVTSKSKNGDITVNQANLDLDASILQAATSVSLSLLIQRDPNTIPALKATHTALDGVLNGSNPMTTQEVLTMLKAQNNPQLAAEITNLIAIA